MYFFDEVNDWGIAALERAIEGLKCDTAVHICYGYGIKANTDWNKPWAVNGDNMKPSSQTTTIGDWYGVARMSKFARTDGTYRIDSWQKVMVGAIDVATHQIETPEQVAETLHKALRFVDAENLYPCTNCGMAPLPVMWHKVSCLP